MEKEKLSELIDLLMDLATYKTITINENEFKENVTSIKRLYESANLKIPKEINMTRTTTDFRSEMQKIGGYVERRERIKNMLYPLMDFIEINDKKINNIGNITQREINDYIINNRYCLKTSYFEIKNISLTDSKAGGNAIVIFGKLNDYEVAIKFLMTANKSKKERFLCEYINVIMICNNTKGIVKQYFYDELVINGKIVPIIVMKKYANSLTYIENTTEDDLISKFDQLATTLKLIHQRGIIHRDLKPQNILIDTDGSLNIADFGISYYNEEIYQYTGHTQRSERLANFEFSAPEQKNSKSNITKAADIYALGQIMYWLVFDEVCKGTRRKKITDKYKSSRMEILDNIIDKCLATNATDRYQNIEEIYQQIKKSTNYNEEKTKSKNVILKKVDISREEIEERIKDITSRLIFEKEENNITKELNFVIYRELNSIDIMDIILNIEFKLKEYIFFDRIFFSDMSEDSQKQSILDWYDIDKKVFIDLLNLYNCIKDSNEFVNGMITYMYKTINNKCMELPF